MAQPIKQTNKIGDYFSKELTTLFNYIVENFVKVYGVNHITPECFMFMVLENKDCIAYKVINSVVNENQIEKIHDEVGNIVDFTSDVINGKFDISKNPTFKKVIDQSVVEKDETQSVLITSDHILLSILKLDISKKLCNILRNNNLVYDNMLENCKELHGITNEIYKKETNKQFQEYKTSRKQIINKKIDFCSNLISECEYGHITPTIGRENEIDSMFTVLSRKNNNNVLLVGDKGVGKTQCVYGLVEKIWKESAPISFHDKIVWRLNVPEVFAGTGVRGTLEEKILKLSKQLSQRNESILYIDDVYSVFGQKHSSGEVDNGSLFNTMFSNPNIQIICSCDFKQLKTIKDNYSSIFNDFQEIVINKPSIDECYNILNGIKVEYENFHNVKYNEDVLHIIIKLCDKYITNKSLPKSAIEIIDEVGAKKKILSSIDKQSVLVKQEIKELEVKKDKFIREDKIDESSGIDEQINQKRLILNNLFEKSSKTKNGISIDDIYDVFSKYTGIPISKLTVNEKEKLKNIENILKTKIIGQDKAVEEVSKAIKRNKVGLSSNNHPQLTVLEVGSTGVGKTLLAKVLAKDILGDEKYLVRFDMSEYTDETSINKLIGSSAGYVGYSDGGVLTEAIKKNKYCVLLIDEIEKAHPKVFNLFLQILDEGFLTDNMGQKVDFKNTYIIMTSNVGTKKSENYKPIGFNNTENTSIKEDIMQKEMKNVFPPEFLNRFDNILFFNRLNDESLRKIISLELKYLRERVSELSYSISYNEEVINTILNKMKSEKEYGARPIKRVIRNEIENRIADLLINNEYDNNYLFNITTEDENIVVE